MFHHYSTYTQRVKCDTNFGLLIQTDKSISGAGGVGVGLKKAVTQILWKHVKTLSPTFRRQNEHVGVDLANIHVFLHTLLAVPPVHKHLEIRILSVLYNNRSQVSCTWLGLVSTLDSLWVFNNNNIFFHFFFAAGYQIRSHYYY